MSTPSAQCCALSAAGTRCTRRVNKDSDKGLCGTHMRGTPHGTIAECDTGKSNAEAATTKIEVRVQEVCGINYYVDDHGNVYDPRDVVGRRATPRVVGTWTHLGDERYRIPQLGVEDPAPITT